MTSPYRLYTFSSDSVGFYVAREDHWYNQFEQKDMVVTLNPSAMTTAFPLPEYTYQGQDAQSGKTVDSVQMNPYTPGNTVSVGAVAPALLGITVVFQYLYEVQTENGRPVGILDPLWAEVSRAVDVSRGQEVPWDYALTLDADPPTMTPVGSTPLTLTFPGDYRLPTSAQTTRMLTDDELWAVAQLATAAGVTPSEMLGILLVLTGARRNAYNPAGAGHYGISNLTAAQVAAGVIAGVIEDVTDFVNASVHGQLAVTARYLSALRPPVSGVLPVFFTLATGQPQPVVTPNTPLPVGGGTMTDGQATTAINAIVLDVAQECNTRMPSSVTPRIGVTG